MARPDIYAEITIPAESFPVGEFIVEAMEGRGWNQKQLAEKLDYSPQFVNDLVRSRRPLSIQAACRLAAVFETGPQVWLRLDLEHRLNEFIRSQRKATS